MSDMAGLGDLVAQIGEVSRSIAQGDSKFESRNAATSRRITALTGGGPKTSLASPDAGSAGCAPETKLMRCATAQGMAVPVLR